MCRFRFLMKTFLLAAPLFVLEILNANFLNVSVIKFETQGNQAFVSDFLELAYSYTLPGYCDWIEYKSDEQFLLKLSEYITILKPLSILGQEVTPITESMLYSVFENPNIDFRIHI